MDMLPRWVKAFYYQAMALPMGANAWTYQHFFAPQKGQVKVHLGPGKRKHGKYLEGWTNVDANLFTARIDVWADFTRSVPFRSGSVDAFYSHHVVEHLPDTLIVSHLKDIYRALKPGGVLRVGGPNGDMAIQKFQEGDLDWFSTFPDARASLGGRFVNFLLCRGEHLTILTESYLREMLAQAGFTQVQASRPKTTNFPALIDDQLLGKEYLEPSAQFPNTLILEAQKT
jgi:predicted SAM-dependent methyltransferase